MKKEYSQIKYNLKKIPAQDIEEVKKWIKTNGIKIITDAFVLDSPTTFQTKSENKYYIAKAEKVLDGCDFIFEVHQMDLLDDELSLDFMLKA